MRAYNVVILLGGTVFDNADFWYGYMAYFGTVALAAVSLWQNENANQANERMIKQQLQQKIGYFTISKADEKTSGIKIFNDIQVGQVYDIYLNRKENMEKLSE